MVDVTNYFIKPEYQRLVFNGAFEPSLYRKVTSYQKYLPTTQRRAINISLFAVGIIPVCFLYDFGAFLWKWSVGYMVFKYKDLSLKRSNPSFFQKINIRNIFLLVLGISAITASFYQFKTGLFSDKNVKKVTESSPSALVKAGQFLSKIRLGILATGSVSTLLGFFVMDKYYSSNNHSEVKATIPSLEVAKCASADSIPEDHRIQEFWNSIQALLRAKIIKDIKIEPYNSHYILKIFFYDPEINKHTDSAITHLSNAANDIFKKYPDFRTDCTKSDPDFWIPLSSEDYPSLFQSLENMKILTKTGSHYQFASIEQQP